MIDSDCDYDWLVIGSGFGGSVSALRLSEKGFRVGVLERGRRYKPQDLPSSAWDADKYVWAPPLGKLGIMRTSLFRHVFFPSQSGVGGGSLVYGGVLYRAEKEFFRGSQWRDLGDWEQRFAPHYDTAERMLGATPAPFDSVHQQWIREMGRHFGTEDTVTHAPSGVFFGEPGKTVPDPYFGGTGPERTGCTRCGACMVGCRIGAVNSLTKNYLWFAERNGVHILPEHRVVDVCPAGNPDGTDGYHVTTVHPTGGHRQTYTTRGVVFAGGALGTNELLANCKHGGSLPRISNQLGELVRTNSESVLTVLLPEDRGSWRDVTASSSVHVDAETHIELLTYGPNADMLGMLYTVLVGDGTRITRPLKWIAAIARHPRRWLATLRLGGWSRRMVMLLVMQSRDNAMSFRARKRLWRNSYRLSTVQDHDNPNPTYIEMGQQAARWLAEHTGGIAQSNVLEALGNIPSTAHLLGGAVIGADPANGVIDTNLNVFGYHNMLVCDGSAMPANPGVNPALTITALAEYAMAQIPAPASPRVSTSTGAKT